MKSYYINNLTKPCQLFMKPTINFVFLVSFLYSSVSYADNIKVIKIGTGNKNALAYPIMSSICDIFNKYSLDKNISCQAIETGGSEDNLNGIISGKYDAGVIKADMEYNVYNGIGVFAKNPYRELRNIFGLHNEFLTLIVKNNSGIKSLNDFKNKRIYIGNKGSGSRILVDKLFTDIGWKNQDFKEVHEEQADQIHDLFCNNKIDAAIYLIGHPNGIFTRTLKECDAKLISFSRKEIETYIDSFRHIYLGTIKKGTYPNQKQDINTFSSQLLLATSANLDEKTVYNFVQIISDHYAELQNSNPALKNTILFGPQTNVIPLHKGAIRYYNNNLK